MVETMKEMKPSDAELQEMLHDDLLRKGWLPSKSQRSLIGILIRAELQRRQQPLPAGEAVSVPDELVAQWWQRYLAEDVSEHMNSHIWIANCAAAYGREQAQWVPVSERLPVVVEVKGGSVNSVLVYSRGGFCGGSDIQVANAVWARNNPQSYSHWMPLPEPPTC